MGSSTGSFVGALYACGSLQSLKEFVLKMDGKKVFSYFDVVFPRSGLLDGTRKLKELFSIHTANSETVNYIAARSSLVATLAVVVLAVGLRAAYASRQSDHVSGDGETYDRLKKINPAIKRVGWRRAAYLIKFHIPASPTVGNSIPAPPAAV